MFIFLDLVRPLRKGQPIYGLIAHIWANGRLKINNHSDVDVGSDDGATSSNATSSNATSSKRRRNN